jgi:hypothetical protein
MTAQPSQFPSLILSGSGKGANLSVELATSPADRQCALELRKDVFVRKGLLGKDWCKPRVSPQACAPGSAIFVAKDYNAVVGTISYYMDSPLGLPMDDLYAEEVDEMRRRFGRAGEIGGLAVVEGRRDLQVTLMLYQAAFRWAVAAGAGCIVACVKLSSRRVYSKMLLFQVLGKPKWHPRHGVPSIPLGLDVAGAPQRSREAHGNDPDSLSHKIFCDTQLPYTDAGLDAAQYLQWSDDELSEMINTKQLSLLRDEWLYVERHYSIRRGA